MLGAEASSIEGSKPVTIDQKVLLSFLLVAARSWNHFAMANYCFFWSNNNRHSFLNSLYRKGDHGKLPERIRPYKCRNLFLAREHSMSNQESDDRLVTFEPRGCAKKWRLSIMPLKSASAFIKELVLIKSFFNCEAILLNNHIVCG